MTAPPLLPPIPGPDAITLGTMATKYTLRALDNEGYINIPTSIFPTTGILANAYGHGTILRYADGAKGHQDPSEPFHIHPCLQRSQWEDMDDEGDWDAILPSVELASRFLDDPCITPFFAGLARRKFERLDDEVLKKRFGKTFYRWDVDDGVLRDEERMEDVLFTMMAMREKVVLRFDTLAHYAETDW
jgi:hypothetical protein